jgi:hypothetical protein
MATKRAQVVNADSQRCLTEYGGSPGPIEPWRTSRKGKLLIRTQDHQC